MLHEIKKIFYNFEKQLNKDWFHIKVFKNKIFNASFASFSNKTKFLTTLIFVCNWEIINFNYIWKLF